MSYKTAALAAVLLCTGGQIYAADEPTGGEESDWYREIPSTEPQLPNRPARRENISDDEVREVQAAALEVYPDFIVVISGVTDGCACEEGSHCTAQVGLAMNRDNQTRSLILSKIDGHWKVGAVQSWWLAFRDFERTHPRPTTWKSFQDWERGRQALLKRYPACPVPAANWTLLRSDKFDSTFVDMSSTTVSGPIRRVNFKRVYPPRATSYVPWTRFSISLDAFDCRDHRMRIDKQTSYLSDGTARPMAVIDAVLWEPIRLDTTSAKDWDLVCSWKSKEQP